MNFALAFWVKKRRLHLLLGKGALLCLCRGLPRAGWAPGISHSATKGPFLFSVCCCWFFCCICQLGLHSSCVPNDTSKLKATWPLSPLATGVLESSLWKLPPCRVPGPRPTGSDLHFADRVFACLFWQGGLWDLSPPTRDWTQVTSMKTQTLNYWAAREFPQLALQKSLDLVPSNECWHLAFLLAREREEKNSFSLAPSPEPLTHQK